MPKRKDGRFYNRVYIGTENGKKQFRCFYGKTQKEADDKAAVFRAQHLKGVRVDGSESFAFWCDAFVEYKSAGSTAAQAQLVASRLKYFTLWTGREWNAEVGPLTLGALKLSEVRPVHLQAVINALAVCNPYTGRPSAKNTLKPITEAVCGVFENAIYNRATDYNPAARLVLPKDAPAKQRRALSIEERERLLTLPHRAQVPALLMMLCGLRRGEVTCLTWDDVDFAACELRVNKSFDFKAGKIKPPKTSAGRRVVPVPSVLLSILQECKKETASELVVPSAHNRYMTESAWKRLLESYLCDLNAACIGANKFSPQKAPVVFQPFTWHDLRHTYATILLEAGVDIFAAREIVGHADAKMLINRYTHLLNKQREIERQRLDSYLAGVSDGVSCFT